MCHRTFTFLLFSTSSANIHFEARLWLCFSCKNAWSGFLQSIELPIFLPSFFPSLISFLFLGSSSCAVILPGCRFPSEPVYWSHSSPETAASVTAPSETWQIDGESVIQVRGSSNGTSIWCELWSKVQSCALKRNGFIQGQICREWKDFTVLQSVLKMSAC